MYTEVERGIKKSLNTFEIIIPTHDNEGNTFSESILDAIFKEISSFFGGMTLINCLGYWDNGKQIFKDKNIKIIVDTDAEKTREIISLKNKLQNVLKQEKIYITNTGHREEFLSVEEFLKELGIEVDGIKNIEDNPDFIKKIVKNQDALFYRLGYKTISLVRENNKIFWEREIADVRFISEFEDIYPKDALLLCNDTLENAFRPENLGKPIIIIGDYESQKYVLDKSKIKFLVELPSQFNHKEEGKFYHPWYGSLNVQKFILFFTGQILINYILLRDLGIKPKEINVSVGSDGSMMTARKTLLLNPANIKDKNLQKFIIKCVEIGREKFERNELDLIALKQAKVLNRYSEKIAMLKARLIQRNL